VRVLEWEGCCNIRDLGGLPTEDGLETRFRAIVRADNVTLLSEPGRQALRDYGVRRIVDLRYDEEVKSDRARLSGIEIVHSPLASELAVFHEIDKLLAGITEPVAWRRGNYLAMLGRLSGNFARAVTAVAEAPEEGPVLIHCAGGVDRTGLVVALLLRVSGVGVDTVADDYAPSEQNWAPFIGEWLESAADEDERSKRRMLASMPAAAMRAVLVVLEHRHQSAERYLLEAGVAPENIERVRHRLRDGT
jgi:protein-tyrosine phosphatase